MVTMWVLWNARNEKIFQGKEAQVVEVKSLSFLWLRSRSKFNSLAWKDWKLFPLYMV
ncbi:hypothetical protein HanRHA438_Chr12g0534371 [Helianthus annuus]|nr:hypothetical protein HanRHA438_Chr12g0534371 [Helianthus annuus]